MGIKFSDIDKANASIRTTDIKGKDYAEVNQRIKAFRMCFPDGFIISDIISNEGGVVIIATKCGYYDANGSQVVLGTGLAYEKEGSTFINKTSYIENCETSAVGRALGMAGFGIDTSVASYEEVSNAKAQQEDEKTKKERAKVEKEKAEAKPVYTCQNCGNAFMDEATAKMSMEKWNKHICPNCIKKKADEVKKKAEEAKKAQAQAQVEASNVDLPFPI